MPKTYAAEFRRPVIDRLRSGHAVRDVSVELGVSDQTMYRWLAQDAVDRGDKPGISSRDHVEVLRARRRILELETELAITKAASSLFAEGKAAQKKVPGDRSVGSRSGGYFFRGSS